jgi:hypothetical protein
MGTEPLPPGVYPIAVDKYIIYHIFTVLRLLMLPPSFDYRSYLCYQCPVVAMLKQTHKQVFRTVDISYLVVTEILCAI